MINRIKRKVIGKLRSYIYKYDVHEVKRIINDVELSTNRLDLLQMLQSIKAYIEPLQILIDVGANEGEFSKSFYSFIKYDKVILIEPNKSLNTIIDKKFKGINYSIINKALSNTKGDQTYYYHEDSQMNSLIPSDEIKLQIEFGDKEITSEIVNTSTLDEVMAPNFNKNTKERVFLKLDTQGNEIDILKGGSEVLNISTYCLIEYMANSPYERENKLEDLMNLMQNAGFKCLGPVYLKKRRNFEIGAVNYLFIKERM